MSLELMNIKSRHAKSDRKCECKESKSGKSADSHLRFAIAKVYYPGSNKSGVLIYMKPTYNGVAERADVQSYAANHPMFPQESEVSLDLTGQQFESYRALGAQTVEEICGSVSPDERPAPLSVAEFVKLPRSRMEDDSDAHSDTE